MEKILERIKKNGTKLENLDSIEVFGRAGNWHTKIFSEVVKSLEIWEIDSKWEMELQKNFPKAKIRILDSISTLQKVEISTKYDFVVIDNPQNLFGPKNFDDIPIYCEHFQILKELNKILTDGYVIFNVNIKPYNYQKLLMWKKKRDEFYGVKNTDNLELNWTLNFYIKLFKTMNYIILDKFSIKRGTPNLDETLYYFIFKLKSVQ